MAGAVLLAATASLLAAPGPSEVPIHGVRGEPIARAVVHWNDMARLGTRLAPARWKEPPGPRRIPQGLPVPEGALVRMEARADAAALPSGMPASPAPAWAAQAILLPADRPTRNAIQWWQLAPDGAVVQRGRVEDATGVRFYAFPSIAVNRNGDMLLGFASFSAEQFASGSYAYRAAGDPLGTLRAERVLKTGEDSYVRDQDGFGTIRWGDYSATSVDPVNDTDFWTIQEYAAERDANGGSRWGTWWGRVVPEIVERTPPQIPERRSRTPRALPPRGP